MLTKSRTRVGKRLIACLLLAFFGSVLTGLLGRTSFFTNVRAEAQDLHFLWRGKLPTPNIVLLTIDGKSLDTFKELLLFWHPYYAEAIQAAAAGGAKVMGIDVTFAVPVTKWEPEYDGRLVEAVTSASAVMPVICGYVPALGNKQADWPVPVNMVSAALGLSGYVNLTADPDDFIRRQEIMEAPPAPGAAPARSLALRVAEKYLGAEAELKNGTVYLAGKRVPVEDERTIRINYAGPAGTFPRISFSDFILAARAHHDAQIRQWVGGKAVLLGLDTVMDRFPTPYFSLLGSQHWNTAGVEVHASALRTLLRRDFLVPAPLPVSLSVVFGAGFIAALLTAFLPFSRAFGLVLLFLIGVIGITQIFFRNGVLLPTLEIPVTATVCVLGASIYRFLTAEKRGDLFRKAITMFVGKQVASSVEETQQVGLSGTREVVTILFSDIRGFTAFCEDKDPAVVVSSLNEYLTQMVAIITAYGGNVNKFIGDGILAIFSASDTGGGEDHATRAVRCGLRMVNADSPFKTGIGIHTGPVIIGSVGSTEKMEYTALGDTVNVAARLEGLNKERKTQLLMTGTTCDRLNGAVPTVHIGPVPVRGKAVAVELYTVAALHEPAETAATSVAS